MPIKHKYVNSAHNAIDGPNLEDNNSGATPPTERGWEAPSLGGHGMASKNHGMQMGPSGFGTAHGVGPQVGLPSRHGSGGEATEYDTPPPAPRIPREGGVRGGGVSALETMPSMNVHTKEGYDEHGARSSRMNGLHGMGSALERHAMAVAGGGAGPGAKPHAMSDEMAASTRMGEAPVHACSVHGCGFKGRSSHGLTQHMQRKHSMGQVRRAIHAMGSTPAGGSSAASGSSDGAGSSGSEGSSGASGSSHGFGSRPIGYYPTQRRPASYVDGDSG